MAKKRKKSRPHATKTISLYEARQNRKRENENKTWNKLNGPVIVRKLESNTENVNDKTID